MKRLIPLGAIAALLILPSCGRKTVETKQAMSMPVTETRVDARVLSDWQIQAYLGKRAQRLEKHGIHAVKLSIQNASQNDLFLREENIGLNLVPAKEVTRITNKSASWRFGKGIAATLGVVAGTLIGASILANTHKAFYFTAGLMVIATPLIATVGVGSSLGKGVSTSLQNQSVNHFIKKESLEKNGIRIPAQSSVEVMVFTANRSPQSFNVGLTDENGRLNRLTATVGRRTA